ncbi:MAG: CRISPR-associated protein Cas4 [Cellulosilyticum sp.]|nr:CRISPR-associated protein Cas4 [Cellulosilyticum sp.]
MAYLIESVIAIFMVFLLCRLKPTIKCIPRKQLGVSRATAIYTDKKGVKMLIDYELGLQGKPDMIFETWILKRYIPLEIKSGRIKDNEPHQGDLYQLVAYFILIEQVYGKKPPYGKLVYANKTFKVRNTAKLRKKVLVMLAQMREMLDEKIEIKVDAEYTKCRHCVCKDTVCKWTKGDKHVF